MKERVFLPKLWTLLKEGISRKQLTKDLTAGVIVGIVALPLAIAFAIASGVSPEKGLITAIIAGIVISAFGGSRVQIGGPTGAFIVIVYAIVQEHGVNGLIIATFLAGFILIAMGLLRLGALLKFIPYPLIVGFTSGIAVIIFSSQIKDFFGLPIETVPADFIDKWKVYFLNFHRINPTALAIGAATVFISLKFSRISARIPGSLVAIVLSTIVVYAFDLPVNTIETAFGMIPNSLSLPSVPEVDYETVKALIQPALAIALLGGIESLLSAVVSDGMIGGRHRSNTELIAQGAANCFSAMFGGIPATGAIARTATNVKNGGRTPIAGIVHALVLLLIMLLLAPLARLIPLSALAGVLIVVAYHMSEWKQFKSLLKSNRWDVLILLVTFFLTVIFDLVTAIEVGIVLSGFTFMKRMSDSLSIEKTAHFFPDHADDLEELFEEDIPEIPDGVVVYEISGALFFGAAQEFQDTLRHTGGNPEVLILRMRHVPFIDATGLYRLSEIIKHFNAEKVKVILSGVNAQVKIDLKKMQTLPLLGDENVCDNITDAIHRAQEIMKT